MTELTKKPAGAPRTWPARICVDVEVKLRVECYLVGHMGEDGVFRAVAVEIGELPTIEPLNHHDVIGQIIENNEYCDGLESYGADDDRGATVHTVIYLPTNHIVKIA